MIPLPTAERFSATGNMECVPTAEWFYSALMSAA